MAFRIFVPLLLLALSSVFALLPEGAVKVLWPEFGGWLNGLLTQRIAQDTLVEINAMGLAILTAGATLQNSQLGRNFKDPTEAESGSQKGWALFVRNTVFESMIAFGFCCLLSTAAMVMTRSVDPLVITSQFTTFGVASAILYFFGGLVRAWYVTA